MSVHDKKIVLATCDTNWKKEKKHFSKIRLREIDAITLIPPTVSQNFQYETHAVTGNKNYVNLLQLVILTENKKKKEENYMQ